MNNTRSRRRTPPRLTAFGARALGAALLFLCLVTGRSSAATTFYADVAAGNNAWNGLSPAWDGINGPKASIQACIGASAHGDTVIAAPGTYVERIVFDGLAIVVRGSDPDDPATVASTVIDGGGDMMDPATTVTFAAGETSAAELRGFTVTCDEGRGIFCSGSSPTIAGNRIVGNTGMDVGGGILAVNASPTIIGNTLTGNGSEGAGAVVCLGGAPVLRNCLVTGNGCAMAATGGILLQGCAGAVVENCTVVGNWSGDDMGGSGTGGIFFSGGSGVVRNSIVRGNTRGWPVTAEQIGAVSGAAVTVSYSNVEDGEPGVYGSVTWGAGNIDADPLFAGAGDCRLQSAAGRWDPSTSDWTLDAQTSPCVDAGDPASDFGAEPAPNGGVINMGCYGNTPQASKSPSSGYELIVVPMTVAVPEGDVATFTVQLSGIPAANTAVSSAVDAGSDPNLSIASGAALTFTPQNWNTAQTVTLAAAPDADAEDGAGTVTVSAPDAEPVSVSVSEEDSDALLTVTNGTPAGTTVQPQGTPVTITAVPPAHQHFVQWTGDVAGVADPGNSPTTITLAAGGAAVAAGCAWDRYTLTVDSPRGDPLGAGEYDWGATASWSVTSPIFAPPDSVWVADPPSGQILIEGDVTVTAAWSLVALPPAATDNDDDGLCDRWELLHLGALAWGPSDDPDGDGATNEEEAAAGSHPGRPDSGGDGLCDGAALARGLSPVAPAARLRVTSPAHGSHLP